MPDGSEARAIQFDTRQFDREMAIMSKSTWKAYYLMREQSIWVDVEDLGDHVIYTDRLCFG